MPLPFPYPYDPEGVLPSNHIANELHNVTAAASPEDANFIVANASPFFLNGLVIRTGPNGNDPLLVEGVDYLLTHRFVEASQSLNKQVYGSITFINRLYSGTVYLTYQTLGGGYTLDDYAIVTNLTRSLYAIQVVTWSQIVGVTVAFPPVEHPHNVSDLTGMTDVVAAIQALTTAITGNAGNVNTLVATLTAHLTGNASHTKDQIGLDLLENYAPATQADIDGLVPNKYVTPVSLYHAIARFNTSGVTVMDATTALKGISRFATDTEAEDPLTLRDDIAVTPAGLWAAFAAYDVLKQIQPGGYWIAPNAVTDPATTLGYGTWARVIGKGFIGYDPNTPALSTVGASVGSNTVTLTSGQVPPHRHSYPIGTGGGGPTTTPTLVRSATVLSGDPGLTTVSVSVPDAVDITPASEVVCIWKRIT